MTNMAAMPIYGKNLKKSSSPEPIDQWPWNLVYSIVYGNTTKIVQIMTLDPFYAKVKLGHIDFCMGKSENYVFFGNYGSLGSHSCLKHSTKRVYEVEWVSKVNIVLWPCSKVTQISKLKLFFLKNRWVIWNQSSYESSRGNGNKNLYKWVGSHDQHGRHAHIRVKTLKNLLQKQKTNDLETWYVALCMEVLPKLFKLWPWIDLDFFYAKVKFGHIGFCMGKSENYLFF